MMLNRLIAFSVLFAVASMAQADIVVDLAASASSNPENPAGVYDPSETVSVDVNVSQAAAGDDHLLRQLQLDFSDTDVQLMPNIVLNWMFAQDRHFYEDGTMTGRGGIRSVTYYGDVAMGDFGPNATYQLLLPGSGSVTVAQLQVTLPAAGGSYELDVVSGVAAGDPTLGGKVVYGFGLSGDQDPVSVFTGNAGTITGGSTVLTVGVPTSLASSVPAHEDSLWRTAGNYMTLTFDSSLPELPVDGVCPITIEQLLDGGQFGGNLAGDFTCSVEGDTLSIAEGEGASLLTHETWVAIRNTGSWAGVNPFEVHYVVVAGDANNDGRVLPNDLSLINTMVPTFEVPADSRFDINGDGRVLPNDLSAANASIPSLGVSKPSGH